MGHSHNVYTFTQHFYLPLSLGAGVQAEDPLCEASEAITTLGIRNLFQSAPEPPVLFFFLFFFSGIASPSPFDQYRSDLSTAMSKPICLPIMIYRGERRGQ